MKKIIICLVSAAWGFGAASLGVPSTATAQEAPLLSDANFYVGASSGFSVNFDSGSNFQSNFFSSHSEANREGFGAKAFAGVDINRHLAAEIAYMYTPELTEMNIFTNSVSRLSRQDNLATFSLILGADYNRFFNPFVKGGGVIAHQDYKIVGTGGIGNSLETGSRVDTGYLLGLGNTVHLRDGLDMRLEWELYNLAFEAGGG